MKVDQFILAEVVVVFVEFDRSQRVSTTAKHTPHINDPIIKPLIPATQGKVVLLLTLLHHSNKQINTYYVLYHHRGIRFLTKNIRHVFYLF
jgi:hypothetical protein